MAKTAVVSPGQALSTGREIFFKNWKDVVKLGLVMLVINFMFSMAAKMIGESGMLTGLVSLAGNLLGAYLGYGFLKAMFMLYDKKAVDIQTLAQPINEAARYVVGTLLFSLGTSIGLVLFLVPGLYFASKYFFVPTLLADTNMSIGEAFAASSKMTDGRKIDMFLYMLLSGIGILIGLLALFIGAVVVAWIAMFGMIVLHRSLLAKAK